MKIKCMYEFDGMSSLNVFTDCLEKFNWRIEKQLLKDRVLTYENNPKYKELKKQFNDSRLSIWALKDEEVITWMDTLLIMRRTMMQLFKKGVHNDKLKVIMEYPLVYGNHMRTDYLIIYERLIIVLEFGMFNQDEKRSEERYTKKLQDSITHRQVLANMIRDQIKIVNYVMIYRPEYYRLLQKSYEENIEYNYREIKLLTDFIMNLVVEQESLSAVSQLEAINIFT